MNFFFHLHSNDPYEFDADEGTSGQMRSSNDKGKSYRMSGKKPKEDEDEDSLSLASRRDVSDLKIYITSE